MLVEIDWEFLSQSIPSLVSSKLDMGPEVLCTVYSAMIRKLSSTLSAPAGSHRCAFTYFIRRESTYRASAERKSVASEIKHQTAAALKQDSASLPGAIAKQIKHVLNSWGMRGKSSLSTTLLHSNVQLCCKNPPKGNALLRLTCADGCISSPGFLSVACRGLSDLMARSLKGVGSKNACAIHFILANELCSQLQYYQLHY